MKRIKTRSIEDLNPVLVAKNKSYAEGFLDACNYLNDEWAHYVNHHKAIGDVALFKFNFVKKRQVRKNPAKSK